MRLLDKFHQTLQHWIAVRILIETYTGIAIMARIGRTDKYYQRKHYSRRMQRDCRCI